MLPKTGHPYLRPEIHAATINFPHNEENWHPQPRVRKFRWDQKGREYLEILLQNSYAYDLSQKSLRLYIPVTDTAGRHVIRSGSVDDFYNSAGPIPFAMLTEFHWEVIDEWSAPVNSAEHENVVDILHISETGDMSGCFNLLTARDMASPQYDNMFNRPDTFQVTGAFTAVYWE